MTTIEKRLRSARRMLNNETIRAAGKMTFDKANGRLISEGGGWGLQYYPPGAAMPGGHIAESEGVVHIESLHERIAKCPKSTTV